MYNFYSCTFFVLILIVLKIICYNKTMANITDYFGSNLAVVLANKIKLVYNDFDSKKYIDFVKKNQQGKTYSQRVVLHARGLKQYLPDDYTQSIAILVSIMGDENKEETGMFTNFYWLLPVSKFIELYGVDDFIVSMNAIAELTKRNTGEYAIRPFAQKYPTKVLRYCTKWAKSKNFHLRRLASEGLRPKLPWATKLDIFNDNPKPVFDILELLKEDEIMFVKKSVANHLRDWLKVNKTEAMKVLKSWEKSKNQNTIWICKHATQKDILAN